MAKYLVTIPMAGYVQIEVEAEDESSAESAAFEAGATFDDIVEWDIYKKLTRGNVLYAPMNEIEVEEYDA